MSSVSNVNSKTNEFFYFNKNHRKKTRSEDVFEKRVVASQEKNEITPQIKAIYHRLTPKKFVVEHLEGSSHEDSIASLIQDINSYTKSSHLSPHECLKLKELIDPLKQALTLTRAKKTLSDPETSQAIKTRTLNDTLAFFQENLKNLKPNQCLIIPGGYKNHKIFFEVKKNENGKLSFTLFDPSEKYSIIYKDLEANQLHDEFWKGILHLEIDATSKKAVNVLLKQLETRQRSNKVYGRQHHKPHNRNCAHKSLSLWFHGKIAPGNTKINRHPIDTTLYENFKLYRLENDLKKLKNDPELRKHLNENVKMEKIRWNRLERILKRVSQRTFNFVKPHIRKPINEPKADFLQKELEAKINRMKKKMEV